MTYGQENFTYSERCTEITDCTVTVPSSGHWHTAMEIIMPIEKTLRVICGKNEYTLEKNDIILIPAGEIHSIPECSGRSLVFICDNASLSGNPAISGLYDIITSPVLINSFGGEDFKKTANRLLSDIIDLYGSGDPLSDVYIYSKLIAFLTVIKERKLSLSVHGSRDKNSDKLSSVVRFIDKNYAKDITLDDLAALTGYSKYHFSRTFRKNSSLSFIELINRRRLKSAVESMLEGKMTVTEAAMNSGFSSLTTFNRVFKEHYGCSPSEFKKLYRRRN